tara:strand:- start:4506 stop:4835 length:330 start_codon:yes stop_codon:yes gene_type:complete
MMKQSILLGLIAGISVITACDNAKEIKEEKPPVEMTSSIYKRITEIIQEEGIEVYNPESGEANFDVFCLEREAKSLECASLLKDEHKDVRVRSLITDTDTLFFAYLLRE